MRASIFTLAAVVATTLVTASACGSDERPGFSTSPGTDGGDETGNTAYADGTAAVDLCDPQVLSNQRSAAGCQFFLTGSHWFPDDMSRGCYVFVVSNVSAEPAHLRLRFKRRTEYDAREEDAAPYTRRVVVDGRKADYLPLEDGVVRPRESVVVSALFGPYKPHTPDWANASACPTKAFLESTEPSAEDDVLSPSIELRSDVPVLATQISGYGLDAMDHRGVALTAFPLVPVHLWETDAIETGIYKPGLPSKLPAKDSPVDTWPGRTFALAAFDDTHVSLPTVDGGPPREVTLRRGEVFSHKTYDALAGRPAHADKPIGLISFTPMTYIDWELSQVWDGRGIARCYSMALPSSQWGSEYVAARYSNRWESMPETPVWRILGGADDTLLSYEPYRPDGAPERIAKGQLAVFFADAAFTVRSQDDSHPFYFSQSMTDSQYHLDRHGVPPPEPNTSIEGDSGQGFTVHQMATSHWKKQYPFFAAMPFADYEVVAVRPRGGPDVRLDCAGTLAGWQPIGERFEYTRVRLTGHLLEPVSYPSGTCQAGAHWIESDGPFWGTLWGRGNVDTTRLLGKDTVGTYALPLLGADDLSRPSPAK